MRGLHLTLCFLMLRCAAVSGQQAYTPLLGDPIEDPWRWTHFEKLDGEQVRTITQAENGDMLFGVERGLLRYDGYRYVRLDKPAELSALRIVAVEETDNGGLLVGTDDGLFRVTPTGWQPLLTVPDYHLNVSDMQRLPDGSMLVGMTERAGRSCLPGLLHLRDGRATLYASRETAAAMASSGAEQLLPVITVPDRATIAGISGRRVLDVQDLLLRRNGDVLLAVSGATAAGKVVVMGRADATDHLGLRHTYGERDGLRIRSKVSMAETAGGELWVVSNAYESGVYRHDGSGWRTEKLSDRFGGVDSQSKVLVASDGTVWVDGHGRLFRYRQGEWAEFKNPEIPITTVSRFLLYEDRDRQLWIAGRQSQVYRFDDTYATWITYRGLNYQTQQVNGRRWYLTHDGRAVTEQDGEWTVYGPASGLIDTPVRLLCTTDGEIWSSGSHRGVAAVAYFDGAGWNSKRFPAVSWSFDARAAFEDRDGGLWFGCSTDFEQQPDFRGGVIHFPRPGLDKNDHTHLAAGPDARITTSYGIGQSRDGRIWVGGKPLWSYDGTEWRVFDSLPVLVDYVDFVETAPNGDLWLGSRFHGFVRHTTGGWSRTTIRDGLASNNTLTLQALPAGKAWATTYGGYSFFDGATWSSGLFPTSLAESREGAGLLEDRVGQLWFNHTPLDWKRRALYAINEPSGSMEGSFRTVQYRQDDLPPDTRLLTEVKEAGPTGDFSIFWTGTDWLNATAVSDLRYSWKLDDGEWSEFSPATYKRFGRMVPGDHRLEVRARDRDNRVDPSPAVLSFAVLPVWWKRWEVVLFTVLALTGLTVLQLRILSRNRRLSVLNDRLEHQSAELRDRNAEVASQRDRLSQTVEEVKKLSQSQLRFFTSVSHEFRTPLSLIIGPVEELLRTSSPAPAGGRLKRYHRIVLRSANRILQLIEQILQVYKVEDNTLAFNPVAGDLVRHCAEITELFHPLAAKNGVQLATEFFRPKLHTRFDRDKVEKILFNLLSNAFKNVPSGGRVTVRLLAGENADTIDLSVRDTGRGIPADKLDRIFERFYHVESEANSSFRTGLGIGLAYVKELVKTHRGTIAVESEPGVMTTFTVTLPWLPVDEPHRDPDRGALSPTIHRAVSQFQRSLQPVPPTDVTPSSTGDPPLKILIVEDDDDTRAFLLDCFSPAYRVVEAANGTHGLELARKEAPDLILADVSMPGLDGFALCRRLKADFDTSHIPVILLTARTAEQDKITGFETGADAYVEKPFNWQVLRSRVGGLIRQREQLRERFREGRSAVPSGGPAIHSVDEQFMRQVLDRVNHHLDDSALDAEQLAREVGVSRVQLYRKLKALTGQTVSQFIRAVRLRQAAVLLERGELTVAEVAYQTGFTAPNHFSTYFRKKYGVSPSQYATEKERDVEK